MQLKIGSYAFAVNAVEVGSFSEALMKSGIQYGFTQTLNINGYLIGDTQQSLTNASIQLDNAVKVQGQDVVLYQDNGAKSATYLINAQAANNVTITKGVDYESKPSSYAINRPFSLVASATFFFTNLTGAYLLEFNETLSFSGGGPLYIMKPALKGPPQRQLVYESTPYVVRQSGAAVGLRGYPDKPPPKFPYAVVPAHSKFDKASPERDGKTYSMFKITWEYTHEWASPLVAAPAAWGGVGTASVQLPPTSPPPRYGEPPALESGDVYN